MTWTLLFSIWYLRSIVHTWAYFPVILSYRCLCPFASRWHALCDIHHVPCIKKECFEVRSSSSAGHSACVQIHACDLTVWSQVENILNKPPEPERGFCVYQEISYGYGEIDATGSVYPVDVPAVGRIFFQSSLSLVSTRRPCLKPRSAAPRLLQAEVRPRSATPRSVSSWRPARLDGMYVLHETQLHL